MPLIRHRTQQRTLLVNPEKVQQEILRMYKFFKETPFDKEKPDELGCYLTMSMLENGHIYWKRTQKGPALRQIPLFKNSSWFLKETTEDSRDLVLKIYRQDGWIVPKNFWLGPVGTKAPFKNKDFLERKPSKKQQAQARFKEEFEANLKTRLEKFSPPQSPASREQLKAQLRVTDKLFEEDVKELRVQALEPQKSKFDRPIPNISEIWFWKLSAKEQAALMKCWGYPVDYNGE